MQLAPVSSQVPLGINIEVFLRTEEDDTAVGNQPGKVILLGIVECGEVHALDFSSNFRVVIKDSCGVSQQIPEFGVSSQALVIVFCEFKRSPVNVWEIRQEVIVGIVVVLSDWCPARLVSELVAATGGEVLLQDWDGKGRWLGDHRLFQ